MTITNTYDVLARVLTRGYPDGGLEKFGYSARGLVAYTNQIGMASAYGYDPAGRKTAETNANLEFILYTNNPAGDLLSLTDAKSQTTKWGYDSFGRVTNKTDQAGTVILKYAYDADARLLSRWSAAMGTTYYTNDPFGNLTRIAYPHSGNVTLQYDSLSRLTNMVDGSGTTAYSYTSGNQLLTESQPFASSTVTNTYLNRLRTRLSLQQPAGVWTNAFTYDVAGRLTNVASPAGTVGWSLATPGAQLIRRIDFPNGCHTANAYDPAMWRWERTYFENSGNTVLDFAGYGFNLAGQRTAYTNLAGTYVLYSYDNIGQLKVATSSAGSENRGYFYDAAWNANRRTNNGAVYNFNVDNKNQLTSTSDGTISYDANGNLTNEYGLHGYTYDDENRLTSVADIFNPQYRTDFVYDGLGRLRKRLEYVWGIAAPQGPAVLTSGSWNLSSTVEYIYDGNRVIQERDGSNTPTVSYTRGLDLSGTMEGAGGIGGLLARSSGYSAGNWTTNHFYHADGNGNVTYLVDASQAMAATYRYDPFGNTISSSGSLAGANLYRFSSKEVHVNTGMYIYLYRFYDPSLQRWLNRDPIGDLAEAKLLGPMFAQAPLRNGGARLPVLRLGEPNLYAFVANNPIRWIDPDGLIPDGPFFPPPKGYNPKSWPPLACPTGCEALLDALIAGTAAGATICAAAPFSIPCVTALAEVALTAQAVADCVKAQKLLPGL